MTADLRLSRLRCEYLEDPIGIDVSRPRLSWQLVTARPGARQSAYQVLVGRSAAGEADLWDSGRVESDQSVHVVYEGTPLTSGERAWWTVRVWDDTGDEAEAESPAYWEAGLLERSDWTGQWIGGNLVGGPRTSVPAPFVRRDFRLDKPIACARLYATALGLYDFHINGERVGHDELRPGWTDYNKRVQFQTYDVTDLLRTGDNACGAILGDGWFCGCVEWRGRQRYGDRPNLLAQIVVTYDDGSIETIATGDDWKVAYGPILAADLLMGESHDARLDLGDWSSPGYDDSSWSSALVFPDRGVPIVAQVGPSVRAMEELTPIAPPQGNVYDLGINMVGRVRIKLKGAAGSTVRLRYAEVLKGGPAATTGPIYIDNLRSAAQTDHFTLKGDPDGEIFEPRFTFHGFRYVEVHGYDTKPNVESLVGVVLHSDTPKTGDFECSEPLLNQLQKNIDWGQRGNFVDIPTDCPQRDERLGWTGDAQVFIRTAAFNRDVAAFFTKWQRDLSDAQDPSGSFPSIAPHTGVVPGDGGPAWADAGIICPWTIYQVYGDTAILAEHYESMARFIAYMEETSQDLIRCYDGYPAFTGYGDWLALDGSNGSIGMTPKDLIGTAFFAHDAFLMHRIASVLGKTEDAARYLRLSNDVKAAWNARFVTPAGVVAGGTQTANVLALHFDLVPDELRPAVADALVRDIQRRGNKLSTGFVGSPYINHVLTDTDRLDVAYKLLFQKNWPSWLYAVTQGATTIWERWDGWTHDKGFQDIGMNSFNHYAYGAIGAWLYQSVAGIDVDPDRPGYKHIVFRPRIRRDGGLSSARATLDSIYGTIESAWTLGDDGTFSWTIVVPPNTTAIAYVPGDETSPKDLSSGRHTFTTSIPD